MKSSALTGFGALFFLTVAAVGQAAVPVASRANSSAHGADHQARARRTLVTVARQAGVSGISAQALADAVTRKVFPRAQLQPPAPEGAEEYFGYSVAISGQRALVGVPRGTFYFFASNGSALTFVYDGTNWNFEAELTPSDRNGAYDDFGLAVALQGTRAVVGADGNDTQEGAAYVFDFDGAAWSQTAKLQPADGTFGDGNLFGNAVALDGDRVLVGRVFDSDQNSNSGAAYTFTYDGTSWTQEAKINTTTFEYIFRNFGVSVALSDDRALIGSVSGEDFTGRAFVFAYDGTSWNLEATLDATDFFASSGFGGSVALQGTRAVVGGNDLINSTTALATGYVFDNDGSAWNLTAKLTPAEGGFGLGGVAFEGPAVALDGNHALLGGVNLPGTSNPRTYLFGNDGAGWTEDGTFVRRNHGTNQYGDDFGNAVALNRGRALVGAPYFQANQIFAGAAYIYSLPRSQ